MKGTQLHCTLQFREPAHGNTAAAPRSNCQTTNSSSHPLPRPGSGSSNELRLGFCPPWLPGRRGGTSWSRTLTMGPPVYWHRWCIYEKRRRPMEHVSWRFGARQSMRRTFSCLRPAGAILSKMCERPDSMSIFRFERVGRSEKDGQGRSYPLIHMRISSVLNPPG